VSLLWKLEEKGKTKGESENNGNREEMETEGGVTVMLL